MSKAKDERCAKVCLAYPEEEMVKQLCKEPELEDVFQAKVNCSWKDKF